MRTKYLCVFYVIALITIGFGIFYASISLSHGTLWKGDYQCDKSSIRDSCLEALHGVQRNTFVLIGCLDGFATMFFVMGIDQNRREIVK